MNRAVFALILLTLPVAGQEGKTFRLLPHTPKAGESVRINAVSESKGGTMTVRRGDQVDKGTMDVKRERIYERRMTITGKTPTVEYRILRDRITTTMGLDGPPTTATKNSPLSGLTLLGFRDASRRWKMMMKEGSATNEQASDLLEIEAYENRGWYLAQPVKVGDTWTINPSFIRYITERDIGNAEVNATATLKAVVTLDQEPTAVIGISIQSLASKENPIAGKESGLSINITGNLHVSLATMLDKKLVMNGAFTTQTRRGDSSTTISLPYKSTVTKTVAR